MPANKTKTILGVLILFLLTAAIVSGVTLVKQRQELREKAAVPTGKATVILSPKTATHPVGESFSVQVKFNTSNIAIAAIAIRLTYSFSGRAPILQIENNQILIGDEIVSSPDWTCPIRTVTPQAGIVNVDIGCVNTNIAGFSTTADTLLASFNLVASKIPSPNPVLFQFDPTKTVITRKSDYQDILATPTSTGTYTIIIPPSPTPKPTPTPTPKPTATPTPKPTATPTPSPTPTPTPTLTPTPTPTPIPTPTSTPTPTPTQAPQTANLTFKIKFQGITQKRPNKTVRVILKQDDQEKYRFDSLGVGSGQNGIYTGVVRDITPDTYDIFIKGWAHLQKKFGNVRLAVGENSQDWSGEVLKVGDFNNSNTITLEDLGLILAVYTDLSIPVNQENEIYDVNSDEVIDLLDIGLVLSNYTDLTVSGDD